jgi:hypothetical protein
MSMYKFNLSAKVYMLVIVIKEDYGMEKHTVFIDWKIQNRCISSQIYL